MKRFVLCAVTFFAVCLFCFSLQTNNAKADSLYVKKIVSLVLDDSGSMDGSNRWEYALYALQNLAAMMNPEDTLFVTTLSSNQPVLLDVSDQRIEKTLNQIRTIFFGQGGTPFEPVVTAFNHLNSQPSVDTSTEYWLIVLTDGEFYDIQEPYHNVEQTLLSFSSKTMPNGSNPKVIYLNIGNTSNSVKTNQSKGLYSFPAPGTGEVINAMAQISDMISGRRRFSKNDYLSIGEKSVSLSSMDVPLANIIVLVQNSDARIINAASNAGQKLRITRSAQTMAAVQNGKLFSTVSRIECDGDNIQPGIYTVEFDRRIDPQNITVLFEPALEIRLVLKINGKEAGKEDLPKICVGDKLIAEYKIFEAGTNDELPLSALGISTAGLILEDETNHKTIKSDESRIEMEIPEGAQKISAWLSIPGFRKLEDKASFTPEKKTMEGVSDSDSEFSYPIGIYRHIGANVKYICSVKNYINGQYRDTVTLTSRQDLIDHNIQVKTSLIYDADKLYGDDGCLYFYLAPQPDITVGTYPIEIYWDGRLSTTTNLVIVPSSYTISIQPEPTSISLTQFRTNPPVFTFSLLEDGVWDASCKEHNLQIESDLPGAILSYDDRGHGVLSFEDSESVSKGTYYISASLANDQLEGKTNYPLEITKSDGVVSLSETQITKTQAELDKDICITARLTVDGAGTPFVENGWTIDSGNLPGSVSGILQEDGSLLVTISTDITAEPGAYQVRISADGGDETCRLTVVPSVFLIKADPSALNLVTDYLPGNNESISFTVFADERELTGEEIRLLSPRFSSGTNEDVVSYTEKAVVYTPRTSAEAELLQDGEYQVGVTLSNGTEGVANLRLKAIVYDLIADVSHLSIAREMLVDNQSGVVFSLLQDGKRMTRDEVNSLVLKAETDEKYKKWVELSILVDNDGRIRVVPYRKGWKGIASIAPLGDMTITIKAGHEEGKATVSVHRGDFFQEWWPYRILPVIIFLIILGEFIKKRFRYISRVYIYSPAYAKGRTIALNASDWFSGALLLSPTCIIPYMADRKRIRGTGIRIKANGSIFKNMLMYSIPSNSSLYRYYLLENDEIQPYEAGKISISNDLELLNDDSPEETNKRRKTRWHILRAGMRLVVYDGSQYSVYLFR